MRTFLAVTILAVSSLTSVGQGLLNPPGPPAPTMKTLEQIEPRTPIDATRTPGDAGSTFRITAPGSYYLTGNIAGESGKVGILVTADNVTIDLNGFSLRGPGASSAIATPAGPTGPENTTVRNGTITNWASAVQLRDKARIERVSLTRNTGVALECGAAALIIDCAAINNGGNGIVTGENAVIRSTAAHQNSGSGIRTGEGALVANCAANKNNDVGIATLESSTVQGCTVDSNFGDGIFSSDRATIVDCTATRNRLVGIFAGSSAIIQRCNASKNRGQAGIKVQDRAQVIECVADETGELGSGDGISASQRAIVKRCTVTANRRNGIFVTGESIVIDNRASDNGRGLISAGIFTSFGGASGSRIEGNQTRDNFGDGIRAATGDIVIRNTSGNNSGGSNFSLPSGATPNFGPIQDPATATSPTANHVF